MAPGQPGTRTSSDHFLIGQEHSDLGKEAKQGKLPRTCDVMKYFFFLKSLPEFKFKPVASAMCCPFKSGSHIANCEENQRCKEYACVVSRVKNEGNWIRAGIPIMPDLAIVNKLKKLHEEHRALAKNKMKPNSNLLQREQFSEKLDNLFDISVPGVEEILEGDRLREEQAREEDLMFLADQRDPDLRKMSVGKERDLDYDEANEDKSLRDTRDSRMTVKINRNNNISKTIVEDKEQDEVTDDDERDDDFEPPTKIKRKDNLVTLTINATAITAKGRFQ